MIKFSQDYSTWFEELDWLVMNSIRQEDTNANGPAAMAHHDALRILVGDRLPKEKLRQINSLDNYSLFAKKLQSFQNTKMVKLEKPLFTSGYLTMDTLRSAAEKDITSGITPAKLSMKIVLDNVQLSTALEKSNKGNLYSTIRSVESGVKWVLKVYFRFFEASDDYYLACADLTLTPLNFMDQFGETEMNSDKSFLCDGQIGLWKFVSVFGDEVYNIIAGSRFSWISTTLD